MVKLELACGNYRREGYIGVDKVKTPETDVVCDLLTFPWPWEDNSVDEAVCVHFFEHIPGKLRPRFMEELWRILKPEARVIISVPPWNSERAYQDFTHEWPPVTPASMHYFSKDWRDRSGMNHGDYDIKCNFEVTAGSTMTEEWLPRAHEVQLFSAKHYVNTTMDIIFHLIKKGM